MAVTPTTKPTGNPDTLSIARRRPIERALGWEGFKARDGNSIGLLINFTIFFMLWQAITVAGWISPLMAAPITEIAAETVKLVQTDTPCQISRKVFECSALETIIYFPQGALAGHLAYFCYNVALGFIAACAIGIPLGLALGASKKLDWILGPYVWALFSTPRLALIGIIHIALGFGSNSKVFMVFIAAVFVIIINTWAGVKTVDQSLIKAARAFGANRLQVFSKIVVPYSLPFIVVGLRIGITRALVVELVIEMMAGSRGLGNVIVRAGEVFNIARIWGMVLILVTMSLILVTLLRKLEQWVAPWRESTSV